MFCAKTIWCIVLVENALSLKYLLLLWDYRCLAGFVQNLVKAVRSHYLISERVCFKVWSVKRRSLLAIRKHSSALVLRMKLNVGFLGIEVEPNLIKSGHIIRTYGKQGIFAAWNLKLANCGAERLSRPEWNKFLSVKTRNFFVLLHNQTGAHVKNSHTDLSSVICIGCCFWANRAGILLAKDSSYGNWNGWLSQLLCKHKLLSVLF